MTFDTLATTVSVFDPSPAAKGMTQTSAIRLLRQKTIRKSVSCSGIGVHSGTPVTMTLHPAEVGTGIRFRRVDIADNAIIPATWAHVQDARLCTVIGNGQGVRVSTIEHLMAALSALQVDNVLVDVSGPEVPVMDGSAAPFVALVDDVGTCELNAPRVAYKVLETVEVGMGMARAALTPSSSLSVDFEIEFPARAIGRQTGSFAMTPCAFRRDLGRARTFALADDLPKLQAAGLGLGGSLENAVVVDGDRVLNPEGLRYKDEFVRHKALDAVGDLALAGYPVLGRYSGYRASHALNAMLVKALLSRPSAVAKVLMTDAGDVSCSGTVSPVMALSA